LQPHIGRKNYEFFILKEEINLLIKRKVKKNGSEDLIYAELQKIVFGRISRSFSLKPKVSSALRFVIDQKTKKK